MVVGAGDGVVGVCAVGDVDDWSYAVLVFLDRGVGEGFAGGVLGEPHGLRGAVDEADHGVFPVADVVAELEEGEIKYPVALVVGVKVEVEGVEDVAGLGDGDDHGGDGGARAA